METVLILAALAALAVSGVTVAAMAARSRRPALRLPNEHGIERASEDGLMEDIETPIPSPIDRTAAVLDLEPIETPKRLGKGGEAGDAPPQEPARYRRSDEDR